MIRNKTAHAVRAQAGLAPTGASRARRRVALASLAIAAGVGLAWSGAPAHAQAYPSRTVKIIVPFAAGGPADVYARFLGQKLQESLGQSFIIENKPGGGAVIGTDQAAKATPDGYTLLMMSNTHTVNESLLSNKPYALMRDLVPVAPVNKSDLILVVRNELPAKSLADILKDAKAKPDGMTYASSGPGTPYHMAGELFKAMAGVKIIHVPYKGSSGARTDVMGGQVDMMFDAITTMAQQAKAGKVRAIAVTGTERSPVMPDLPTVSEAGVPGYEAVIWLGLMAPKGTPQAVLETLNGAVRKIIADPAVKAAWAKQGASPMSMDVAAFGDYLRKDIEKWSKIVEVSGAKVN
ncbi:MAG: Bug family tripartite tricarboxylate transporter substrate binding protein [Lautropia sp.]